VNHVHLIEPGRRQRQIERGGDILRLHSRTELPGDNEAREVVEHGGEIVPAPARDLEIGEVGLPEDGSTYSRLDLTLVRTYVLGDRWQGDVSISGNSILVVTNSTLGGRGVVSVTIDARRP
jgi:hypothetical protein